MDPGFVYVVRDATIFLPGAISGSATIYDSDNVTWYCSIEPAVGFGLYCHFEGRQVFDFVSDGGSFFVDCTDITIGLGTYDFRICGYALTP